MQSYILPATLGSAVGPIQTFLLREFVDTPMANNFLSGQSTMSPVLIKPLKGFSTPSALAGIASGIIGLGLGLYAAKTGKIFRTFNEQLGVLTYGASSLASGVMSGIYPTTSVQNAIAKDPDNPIYTQASGGSVSIQPAGAMRLVPAKTSTSVTPNQSVINNFA
ncbi:MAG: hypothetical protein ACP5MB_11115 [bacterium]